MNESNYKANQNDALITPSPFLNARRRRLVDQALVQGYVLLELLASDEHWSGGFYADNEPPPWQAVSWAYAEECRKRGLPRCEVESFGRSDGCTVRVDVSTMGGIDISVPLWRRAQEFVRSFADIDSFGRPLAHSRVSQRRLRRMHLTRTGTEWVWTQSLLPMLRK